MMDLRSRIWWAIYSRTKAFNKPGETLPNWLTIIRCLLFPSEFLWYLLNRSGNFGYDIHRLRWQIGGIYYPDEFFKKIGKAPSGLYCLSIDPKTKTIKIHGLD